MLVSARLSANRKLGVLGGTATYRELGDVTSTGWVAHARNPSTIVLIMPVTMHFLAGSLVCTGKDRTVAFS